MLHRIWGNLSMLAVGAYLVSLVLPATRSSQFQSYTWPAMWMLAAVAAATLCLLASVLNPRHWQLRVAAAISSSTYILCRGLYTEWRFPKLSPTSSLIGAIAFATVIAWNWGRPPIVRGAIKFPDKNLE